MFKYLLAGATLATCLVGVAAANAGTTVLGTEDPATGFVGTLFPGASYNVASDGENAFNPYGASSDTSDGLNFSGVAFVWTQAADSTWTSLGNQTWVLPASTPCGVENEPVCEPVGHFTSPTPWTAAGTNYFVINEAGGGVSDVIKTFNDANGAELFFYSDPIGGVPEPATWAMMLVGLGGLGAAMRMARGKNGAADAVA
jgi:hypothetical protein